MTLRAWVVYALRAVVEVVMCAVMHRIDQDAAMQAEMDACLLCIHAVHTLP